MLGYCAATFIALCLSVLPIEAAASSAANEGGEMLSPSSAWTIEPDRFFCRLNRHFGQGEQRITLSLRMPITKSSPRWLITYEGSALKRDYPDVMIELLPQGQKLRYPARAGEITENGQNFISWRAASDVIPEDLNFAEDQILKISVKERSLWSINASAMGKAMAALNKCLDEARKALGWNEDIAVPPEPATYAGRWATNDDYPPQSLRNQEEGYANFLLLISESGVTTDCHIVESSGFAALDEKTCALMMKRAIFHPARDASGKAVKSQYNNRVMWLTPR